MMKNPYYMNDGRISGYFHTKYNTVLQIEPILHNFEDQKIAIFLTSNRSIFVCDARHISQ